MGTPEILLKHAPIVQVKFSCQIVIVFLGIILEESKNKPDENGLVWKEDLGSGNFGTVHKCLRNGEFVAVKKINSKNSYQEVTVLQKLKHPNIVHLKQVIEKDESVLLVMPLYTGSLERLQKLRLREKKFFHPEEILFLLKEITQGLEYLHSQGYVHRDLKVYSFFL